MGETKSPSSLLLPFEPPLPSAPDAAPPAVPEKYAPMVERKLEILGECLDHRWTKFKGRVIGGVVVKSRHDFICGRSNELGAGLDVSTIYRALHTAQETLQDDAIPKERKWDVIRESLIPKPRLGRPSYFFGEEKNAWQWPFLRSLYLNQSRPSVRRCFELLLKEIRSREVAAGGKAEYDRPTLRMVRIALRKLDCATVTLARYGEKAYSDRCAPYISRRPPPHVNLIWVVDQRLSNVRLRDAGNRLGRLWEVNFIDVASWRWLGGAFGFVLSSDMVMEAAAMALERAGVPRAVHMDWGREFIGKRFTGGLFKVRGQVLFGDCMGLWDRLGVKAIRAIARNPQTKIIEAWHHIALDPFDQEQPGWCGGSPDEKPEKLAAEEAAHEAWREKGVGQSPLLTAPEYMSRRLDFCQRRWNAQYHLRGRYHHGMTPNEVWNTQQPPEGRRILTPAEVDFYCSDHRRLTVARGGQVNLTLHGATIEYEAPELFYRQGETVEVIVPRRSLRQVTVIYSVPGGTASCVATRKRLHDWLPENRDELRQALRCRAALRREIKRGFAAREVLDGTNLVELPPPDREISGDEWRMRGRRLAPKTLTSEEIARRALEIEEGP